jgi:hypothetical protein
VGSGPVGECAMRNVRFVATADRKLVTVRRMSRASFVLRKQFESLNTNWLPTRGGGVVPSPRAAESKGRQNECYVWKSRFEARNEF